MKLADFIKKKKDTTKSVLIQARIPSDVYEEFVSACKSESKSISEMIRTLIEFLILTKREEKRRK